ncbi:glycosyltransferase family 2 protein [Flavobacterium sp.]
MPFFSVIIPVFNKAPFIEKTLKSVLAQTFTDFEIIIVNDGSTDQSGAKILAFEDSRIRYFAKANEGVSSARNFGIDKAEGDYICFLDADDYWYPDFLQTVYSYIQKVPEKVFGLAYENEIADTLLPAQYSFEKTSDYEVLDYFEASLKTPVLWTSSAAFHKEVFNEIGNFKVGMQNLEDIDLWIRIGLKYPVVFIWKVQSRYGYDRQGLSKNKRMAQSKIDFSEYGLLEKTNKNLKIYLDLNRYALAIKSKLINDCNGFDHYYKDIDLNNLTLKKRVLLKLPGFALRILVSVNRTMAKLGLGNSVFR